MARDHRLIGFAKDMRRAPAPAEERLWRALRARRHGPTKFSRQVVIGPLIVDFAARRAKLAVELDGSSHEARGLYDEQRTAGLEALGYRVIRFANEDVRDNREGVARGIFEALETLETSPRLGASRLSLSPQSGERAGP